MLQKESVRYTHIYSGGSLWKPKPNTQLRPNTEFVQETPREYTIEMEVVDTFQLFRF